MLDTLKDLSVVFSFDRSGYERHARDFEETDDTFFLNKRYLITGGTSGIGEALASRLLTAGAEVIVTGRHKDKFDASDLRQMGAKFVSLDMTDFHAIRELACEPLDGLVCNAGGMPDELHIIDDKYDLIFASQVIGHYLLIHSMIEKRMIQSGSPIHITSSGGMYPVKLRLDDLTWQERQYDKVKSYANAKRAQVILNQELAKHYPQQHFSCSHPGWVGTQALKEALPGFTQRIASRLRSADQGADTIYWCLYKYQSIDSGKFWFDRQAKDPYPFFWTKESPETRQSLLDLCREGEQENRSRAA